MLVLTYCIEMVEWIVNYSSQFGSFDVVHALPSKQSSIDSVFAMELARSLVGKEESLQGD